jgi:hypothetical protein
VPAPPGGVAYGNHTKLSKAKMSSAFHVMQGSPHVLLQISAHLLASEIQEKN